MGVIKYNKSKTYLLPLLSEVVDINFKFFDYLQNTYIFDKENQYQNCIFVKHKFNFRNPEFTHYENNLVNNQYFIDLIDKDEEVIYIFKFPEEYLPEYNYYINGQYSKYAKDAKELILDFYGRLYNGSANALPFLLKVRQILFKDEKLKKQLEKDLNVELNENAELGDAMNKLDETIDLSLEKDTIINKLIK